MLRELEKRSIHVYQLFFLNFFQGNDIYYYKPVFYTALKFHKIIYIILEPQKQPHFNQIKN